MAETRRASPFPHPNFSYLLSHKSLKNICEMVVHFLFFFFAMKALQSRSDFTACKESMWAAARMTIKT